MSSKRVVGGPYEEPREWNVQGACWGAGAEGNRRSRWAWLGVCVFRWSEMTAKRGVGGPYEILREWNTQGACCGAGQEGIWRAR